MWCFSSSPLYGKNDITTFERYFLNKEDRKAFKEEKNAYYKYVEDEEYCKKVLQELNTDKERSIISNGHMPVNVKNGESPIKANGKYIVIDGGLSKAYHNVTGIAGYTLVFNSYGFKLIAHDVFKSKEDAEKLLVDKEIVYLSLQTTGGEMVFDAYRNVWEKKHNCKYVSVVDRLMK